MNIFNLDFWYYGIAFIAAPVAFSLFAGIVSRVKDKASKNIFNLVGILLLVLVCIVSSFSFVMFLHKLVGVPVLLWIIVPIAVYVDFAMWYVGTTLLLAGSDVTVVDVIDPETNPRINFAAGPLAKGIVKTPDGA